MTFPLSGVRVLDLGDEPVALASRLLGDLGADVVRVEHPDGDWLRKRGPFVADEPGIERGLAHFLYNAGKRSVSLDLETATARTQLRQLIGKAAVVIAPLQPSDAVRDMLAKGAFEADYPGVGLVQPLFRRNAAANVTDLIGLAAGGQLYLNGDAADPPNHAAGNLAYKQLALASAFAAMTLVLEGYAGRTPGRIEVSMQEAVMWTTIQSANENYAHWNLPSPTRHGIGNVGGQTIFSTADGKFVSFYHHPPAFLAFARWYAELFGDEQFTVSPWDDGFFRFQNGARIKEVTQLTCSSMDRITLVAEAQKRGILCVPVQDVAEIASDEHLRERDFFQQVHVEQLSEEFELVRPPLLSSSYRASAKAPPALGLHTAEVFREWCGIDLPESEVARA